MNSNMKHILITLFLTVTMTSQSWSQDTWVKTFGGTSSDVGLSVSLTSENNLLITGSSNSNDGDFNGKNKGNRDIFVIKLDSEGNIVWKMSFGGTGEDWGYSMTPTSDDGVLISGFTQSNDGDFKGMNRGLFDIFVMKLDMDGNVEWKKIFGGTGDDQLRSMIQSSDGGVLITGNTNSNDGDFKGMNKGNTDIFVMKLDEDGEIKWTKLFGGRFIEYGMSVATTSNDGILITGYSNSDDGDFNGMNKGDMDIFVIKLDSEGNIVWKKSFGGSSIDYGFSITLSSDSTLLVTGSTGSNDSTFIGLNKGGFDIFIIKLDKDGETLWSKTFGGSSGERCTHISTTTNDDIVITGYTQSNDSNFSGLNRGMWDVFVMKLDNEGEILMSKTFGGTSNEYGNSFTTSSSNELLITGTNQSNDGDFMGMNQGIQNIFVMKLDSNGNLNPSTSVTDYTSITPSLLVTPNPISTSSTVVFSTGTPTTVRIELLNTLGESVSVLHDGFMESGEHRVPLGVSSVSSGVYYVRMTSEGTVNSTQVVVLK